MLTDTSFWIAISFFLFVIIAYKPGKKFILKILDERTAKIINDLAEANYLKEQAEKLLAVYQDKQKLLPAQLDDILKSAERNAKSTYISAIDQHREFLNNKRKAILRKINSNDEEIIRNFNQVSISLATEVTKKIAQDKLNSSFHQLLINKSVTKFLN